MNTWTIEYWNPNKKETFSKSSADGDWTSMLKDNVLFLYVQYIHPENNLLYTKICSGWDNYFFNTKTNEFGGWNDYYDPDFKIGRHYKLEPDGEKLIQIFEKKPEFVQQKWIKYGIMLDEPWSTLYGFTNKMRSVPPPVDGVPYLKG